MNQAAIPMGWNSASTPPGENLDGEILLLLVRNKSGELQFRFGMHGRGQWGKGTWFWANRPARVGLPVIAWAPLREPKPQELAYLLLTPGALADHNLLEVWAQAAHTQGKGLTCPHCNGKLKQHHLSQRPVEGGGFTGFQQLSLATAGG